MDVDPAERIVTDFRDSFGKGKVFRGDERVALLGTVVSGLV